MFARAATNILAIALISDTLAFSAASAGLRNNDSGSRLTRLLQEVVPNQFDEMPDICSGFEMLIDQIPNGRDSCQCTGISIDCVFVASCDDGSNDPDCGDVITYEVTFGDDELTIASCAHLAEGGFEDSCVKVGIAPDLRLAECISSTYGGKPCECNICDDRESINIDCTAYEPSALSHCQPLGLTNIDTPMGPTFPKGNVTKDLAEPVPPQPQPPKNDDTSPKTEVKDTADDNTETETETETSGASLTSVTQCTLVLALLSLSVLI